MALSSNNKQILDNAVRAIHERIFFAQYPEHPKAYGEDAPDQGLEAYKAQLNNKFSQLHQPDEAGWLGEENSPYTNENINIQYPKFEVADLVARSKVAFGSWKKLSTDDRAQILIDALERIKSRFFEIAHATMHTTGQSFMMSFQASGPHANDRALEAVAACYYELNRYPKEVEWVKPMGKFNVELKKTFKPIAKGVGLVIGCSTFPVWNTVPGVFANLMAGNSVIIKPHQKAVYPIAIIAAELQAAMEAAGVNAESVLLAVDAEGALITKELAEHKDVKLIDYTGGSAFGDYIESIPNKTVFTEKAGVNSVILDSVEDMKAVMQNLSFAVSLYSGQMCTAPQNFFIPEGGVKTAEGHMSYDEVLNALKQSISGLVAHPKMGAGTLGAIQNPATLERAKNASSLGNVAMASAEVENAQYANARICAPTIIEVTAADTSVFEQELFGPIIVVIKTADTNQSIKLAQGMAENHGAITCAAYTTDDAVYQQIEEAMESVFAPVSFNLTGFIWVNQHAAFSDFHVTGGNPSGNASFTNADYVNRRFVWVGHRRIA